MGELMHLADFTRGTVDVPMGKMGPNMMIARNRRAILRQSTDTLRILPLKRRIGRLGPTKVLEFPHEP